MNWKRMYELPTGLTIKVGDKVKIKNVRLNDGSYNTFDLIEITDQSVKVTHPDIAGVFTFGKSLVLGVEK